MTRNDKILKVYVLPLYGIETSDKDVEKIYLNKDGSYLFLQLKELSPKLESNLLYSGVFEYCNKEFYMFKTSIAYAKDIIKIIKGEYSKLSKNAKNTIIQLSGLPYMKKQGKETITHSFLLALLKHKKYKKILEDRLGVELQEENELMDKLTKETFIDNLIT
jgi:hypothetical protein